MARIDRHSALSIQISDNAIPIENPFFANGDPIPSTSANLTNLATLNAHMPKIKSNSSHQECLKLSTIFPNVDPEFLKETYTRKSWKEDSRNEVEILEAAIEEISIHQENHTHLEISVDSSKKKKNLDDVIEYLKSVFPNANPLYLKTIASKYSDELYSLEKFVEEKLKTLDYPTIEDCTPTYTRNKKRNQQQEYVDSFDVEEFLASVPEPFKVFENSERKYSYDIVTFELLKNHFNRMKISTIADVYTRCGFNTSLAFETLKSLKSELKKKRKKTQTKAENARALLEFQFILNKQRIKNYIMQKRKHNENLLQKMRDNKEFLECECCYEEIPALSTATTCGEGHVFCQTCLRRGTEAKLGEANIRIVCFAECKSEFSLVSLQKVLEPSMFKILLSKIQEHEILSAKIEGLVLCPFCHFALILPEKEQVFRCMNPDCGKESCRLCKKLNHLPKECEVIEKNKKARLILEEQMTAAFIRKCGNCGLEMFKEFGGCNVVTCKCGVSSCYSCGKTRINHGHLSGKCAVRTTIETDSEAVVYVAKEVESTLLKLDPNLKIDVKSVLPTIGNVSKLYQNATEHNHLPDHALKATNINLLQL